MQINVQLDTKNLKSRTLREAKNLAYSVSQALNSIAKEAQTAERVHMDQTYHLRKAGFMYRLVKIFQFSSARNDVPFVEIGIDKKARTLLGVFEEGGPREPFKGKNVAVPITGGEARPTDMATIPAEFTFQKMKFKKHVTAEGKVQWRGANGTFLIPDVGVFKRTGEKKTEGKRKHFIGSGGRVLWNATAVKLLYKLMAPGQIKKLSPNLHFKDTVVRIFKQKFSTYFYRNYNKFKQ